MDESPLDIAVIGAGIGGACAAIAAARRGLRVGLFEAGGIPRHKVCGEFLSPEILDVFNRLGLMEAVSQAGAAPITAARIFAGGRESSPLPLGGQGLALSRFRLDQVLWEAAHGAGVECRSHAKVRNIMPHGKPHFSLQLEGEERLARFVIAAPGRNARLTPHREPAEAHSKPQRYAGFKTHFRGAQVAAGEVQLHAFRGGYCGLVGIESGLVNACLLASYPAVAGRAPEVFWENLLARFSQLAKCLQGAEQILPWLTTANVSFYHFHPTHHGILYCGDGAGYIHPLTGDGMAMAAQAAELAVATCAASLQGGLSRDEVAPLYESAWNRAFRRRLQWGARLHPLLTTPALASPALAGLAAVPALGRMVIRGTRG